MSQSLGGSGVPRIQQIETESRLSPAPTRIYISSNTIQYNTTQCYTFLYNTIHYGEIPYIYWMIHMMHDTNIWYKYMIYHIQYTLYKFKIEIKLGKEHLTLFGGQSCKPWRSVLTISASDAAPNSNNLWTKTCYNSISLQRQVYKPVSCNKIPAGFVDNFFLWKVVSLAVADHPCPHLSRVRP